MKPWSVPGYLEYGFWNGLMEKVKFKLCRNMTRHNFLCLGGVLLSIVFGILTAKYYCQYVKSYEHVSISKRLENEAFNVLCVERYPVETDIYRRTQELSSDLNKEKNYANLLDGMLVNMKKDINNYDDNCKK